MSTVRNNYVLIAREVSTDMADNMTSIIKIIERFNLNYESKELDDKKIILGKQPISFKAKYIVATSWFLGKKSKESTDIEFKLSIIDPKGLVIDGPRQKQEFPAGYDRINLNINMEDLPVTVGGYYRLIVELSTAGDAVIKGEYPYLVELNEAGSK